MKEVDNLESIKEEWVCETGSDNQPLSDDHQRNCEYFVDSLFEEAEKVGAKCMSPTEQKKQVDVSIKLWKNGFTVNDDFRSYSDGASQQFLNSIKKGELPLELQGIFDKEEVDVKVEDKKNEVCMSTKPVFQPFSGQGHRLGSATPKIVSKAKSIEVENKNNLSVVQLNNLEPITNVQIWLANGKRIVQKFNISHRVLSANRRWLSLPRGPAPRTEVPRDLTAFTLQPHPPASSGSWGKWNSALRGSPPWPAARPSPRRAHSAPGAALPAEAGAQAGR
ncbi:UBX domain-containing protein 2A isoform X1 [Mirounga leonina]|uniref:UBX domain-containing protein 2A isoform X1 n=1 Tax=Mirounga leonina TaxID=9715 RepID=UPI00156C5366|nr:UBX domain-containing protein 2A isoform X1 [Mirounga leonina]